MSKNPKKFLDTLDKEGVFEQVTEKQALPELILKRNIIEAQDNMLLSERKLMYHYRTYNRYIQNDIIHFECNIILLFGFIKAMIYDYGVLDRDIPTIKDLIMCENGKRYTPETLRKFKNLLLKYLHLLNITNLFRSQNGSDGLDDM